ncbi:hypothetical protein EYV94_08490 [Puteibacter caeruleilacunae]|nr:hypothetical protein EYV94_08490 [Puteibacter caeruleilacunae]
MIVGLQNDYKNKFATISALLALAVAIPFFSNVYLFRLTFSDAYFRFIGDNLSALPPQFYLLTLVIILLPFVEKISRNNVLKERLVSMKYLSTFNILLTVIILSLALHYSYDKRVSQMVTIASHANQENWENVLEIANEYDGTNYLVSYYANVALLNSGEIEHKLFDYNQSLGAEGLFFTWDRSRKKSEHGGRLYYDLGFINEAHHWAFESMVSNGENASQLQMLALTNLVNERTKAAKKYLSILKKTLFYADWSKEYLSLINSSETLNDNGIIVAKRSQVPKGDFFMNLNDLVPDLVQMLKSNPDNEAACKYLLTYYLLSNQIDLFAETLVEFKNHFKKLSPLYQQALFVHLLAHPTEKEKFNVFEISNNTELLFKAYVKGMQTYKPRRGNIPQEFSEKFGTTFWYYLHFVSPHGNKVISKR